MANYKVQVRITSFTVAPWPSGLSVTMGVALTSPRQRGVRSVVEIVGVKPEWLTDLRVLITGGPNGAMVNYGAVLEYDAAGLVALWDLGMGRSMKVKPIEPSKPSEVTEEEASKALKFINRHRARCAQRPLDPVASGWTRRDLVIEAKDLGWDGKE